jgi:hypothetical protein
MAAPFRIRKTGHTGHSTFVTRDAAAPAVVLPADEWLERLTKLIPGEVLAVYLTGKNFATHWPGQWAIACFCLVIVIRAWGTREPGTSIQWGAVAIAAVSFVIWLYAMGGSFPRLELSDPAISSLAVLLWTTVVPIFYRGD